MNTGGITYLSLFFLFVFLETPGFVKLFPCPLNLSLIPLIVGLLSSKYFFIFYFS